MAENNKVNSVSFFNSRLTSIISIALVLFLLGLILLMGLLGNQLSVYVRENISFSIVLKDNQKEADIKRMQKSLDALPFIKSTEYISKEQAAKESCIPNMQTRTACSISKRKSKHIPLYPTCFTGRI